MEDVRKRVIVQNYQEGGQYSPQDGMKTIAGTELIPSAIKVFHHAL